MSKDKEKDPKKAAAALYDAMKGFGTNEKKIIDTLVGYAANQHSQENSSSSS